MRLDYISVRIIKTIAINPNISINQLCNQICISRRHFYYRLGTMNDWLTKNNFRKIDNSSSQGLTLLDHEVTKILDQLDLISTHNYELKSNERMDQILIFLILTNKPVFLDDLNQINRVSRNTTLNDINIINQKYHGIIIFKKKQGYCLTTDVLKQRFLALQIIQIHFKFKSNFIYQLILDTYYQSNIQNVSTIIEEINNVILAVETSLKRHFTDKDRQLLCYMLLITLLHVINNKQNISFNQQQKNYLWFTSEWYTAKLMQKTLRINLDIQLPDNEILFVSLLLSILKSFHSDEKISQQDSNLIRYIRMLIAEFQRLAGVYFIDKIGLQRQLFMHLKPAIRRGLFNINIENLLLDDIEQLYPQIFSITKRVVTIIEAEYHFQFTNHELGYIAMTFAAWINKNKETKEKNILLISEDGVSVTSILEQKLRKLTVIPLIIHLKTLQEYKQGSYPKQIELIITTTNLPDIENKKVPVIKVKPILTNHEQLTIRQLLENRDYESQLPIMVNALMNEIDSYIPKHLRSNIRVKFDNIIRQNVALIGLPIKENFTLEQSLHGNIGISRSQLNWNKAIDLAGQPLIKRGLIKTDYLQEIKENINKFGMYMYLTPNIVLLHASPIDNQPLPYLSLLKVTRPIPFKIGQKLAAASIIFLLVPEKTASHIKLLEQLNVLLTNQQKLNDLLKANNIESIKRVLFNS